MNCSFKMVSIIVPVYKSEKYLTACLESIFKQTYQIFELILVNDGSPDCCGEICEEWAKKDHRIRVVHKENGGAASARNAGLDIAQGKYIAFIDSDDTVHPQYLEHLVALIESANSDIAMCHYDFFLKTGNGLKAFRLRIIVY